jgi:hypothetical protein
MKTKSSCNLWEETAFNPKKTAWEWTAKLARKQTRFNNRQASGSNSKRQKTLDAIRENGKQLLQNEKLRLNLKSTSHKPATILELLGNPI